MEPDQPPPPPSDPNAPLEIDLDALTERVLELLRRDTLIDQERRGDRGAGRR